MDDTIMIVVIVLVIVIVCIGLGIALLVARIKRLNRAAIAPITTRKRTFMQHSPGQISSFWIPLHIHTGMPPSLLNQNVLLEPS